MYFNPLKLQESFWIFPPNFVLYHYAFPSSGGDSGVWLQSSTWWWADNHCWWHYHQHQKRRWRLVGRTAQRQKRFVPWQLCKSEYKVKTVNCFMWSTYIILLRYRFAILAAKQENFVSQIYLHTVSFLQSSENWIVSKALWKKWNDTCSFGYNCCWCIVFCVFS